MSSIAQLANSTTFYNTATGKSVDIINHQISDLDLLGKLCYDFQVWHLIIFSVIIGCLILKLVMIRLAKRKPNDKNVQNILSSADNLLDMFFIMVSLVNIFLILWSMIS